MRLLLTRTLLSLLFPFSCGRLCSDQACFTAGNILFFVPLVAGLVFDAFFSSLFWGLRHSFFFFSDARGSFRTLDWECSFDVPMMGLTASFKALLLKRFGCSSAFLLLLSTFTLAWAAPLKRSFFLYWLTRFTSFASQWTLPSCTEKKKQLLYQNTVALSCRMNRTYWKLLKLAKSIAFFIAWYTVYSTDCFSWDTKSKTLFPKTKRKRRGYQVFLYSSLFSSFTYKGSFPSKPHPTHHPAIC